MSDHPFLASRRSGLLLTEGVTKGQLRGPAFEQRTRGLHRLVDAEVDVTTGRVADAIGLMTAGCHLGGWAALHAQGNTWFDGLDRAGDLRPALVHFQPGAQLRRRSIVQPFRGLLHPDETMDLGVFSATTLARAAFDEMRMAGTVREAVVVADMACSTTSGVAHTTIGNLLGVISSHHKVRGIVQATKAVALASSRSASPWETRTRLVAQIDAGLPRLLVNVPVFSLAGDLLAIVDLLEPEAGLVIESDGAHHREADAHSKDNRREEGLEHTGLAVCRATAVDHGDRWSLARRMTAAYRTARQTTRRDWTVDQPPWWARWARSRGWS